MKQNAVSIRPFIGAKNFEQSRSFYQDIGFNETILSPVLSLFTWGELGFYLQDAYIKEWIDNTMIFFQVENVQHTWDELVSMELTRKYQDVKLTPIRVENWGRECFLHDSGILVSFIRYSMTYRAEDEYHAS
jgi:hypothetical protein